MPTDPRDAAWSMPGPSVVTFGFDVLDRVEQAVAMVKERLKRAVAALDAAGIPHAVARMPPVLRPRLEQLLADPNG